MVRRLVRIGSQPSIAVEWVGRGPLVVFLHGIGANRHAWDTQLDALSPRFTAAAWDARGYLDSDDYDGPLRFEDFAGDLERVLDAFKVERGHLVGSSMGGRIALDFYARHRERVATLALVDTSAGSPVQGSAAKIEEFLNVRRKPLLEGKTPADIAPNLARTLVGPHCDARTLTDATRMLSALRTNSYLKTLETVTRFTGFPQFEKVDVPALIIVGEHDRIAPPDYAAEVARRMPNATLKIVPGVGHLSNMEDPQSFNTALLDFLMPLRERASEVTEFPGV